MPILLPLLFIKWTSKFKIGISIIDEQHRGLVSIINSFYFHKDDEVLERFLAPTADTLMASYRIHFLTEEDMMAQAEYPDLENHRKEHSDTVAVLEQLRHECSKAKDPLRFIQFMKDYWFNHVNDVDRRYADTLLKFYDSHS
jgi:hemerythrin